MVQSRGPDAFKDGVAHLMFVGVRPLIVSHPSPNMLSPPLAYVTGDRCSFKTQEYISDGRAMAKLTVCCTSSISHANTPKPCDRYPAFA